MASQSAREVDKLQQAEAGGPHPIQTAAPAGQNYEWTDRATGEVHKVPVGIDPGWDYNVGQASWGKRLSDESMSTWRAQGKRAWENLTPGNWQTLARPQTVPEDMPHAKVGKVLEDAAAARVALERILGGPEKAFKTPAGDHILVNAASLVDHIAGDLPARSPYLPLLPELFESPYEIWASFERHKGTGKVVLRQRFIKVVQLDKKRAMIGIAQVRGGALEAWTFFSRSKLGSVKNERVGNLLWGR